MFHIPDITVGAKLPKIKLDSKGTIGIPSINIGGPSIGAGLDISGPKIGLPNVDVDINAPRIGGGLDIHGPKIGAPSLDINGPKIGGWLDIHGPKIGVPSVDVDINAPKIGGGIDIHGPKMGAGLDIHGRLDYLMLMLILMHLRSEEDYIFMDLKLEFHL